MKILTLNIRQGGGTRLDKLITRLLSANVDTLVLTEFRENQHSATIKNALIGAGYLWQASCLNEPNINSILIASRFEFENTCLDDLPECCDHRALLLKFPTFSLLAVYFAQRNEKQVLFDYISDKCIQQLMPKGIVIGDFNTGKPFLDEPKKSFACIDAFINLENIDLVDSWRSSNLELMEFS